MKWSMDDKSNRNFGLELKCWKVYVENEKGEKMNTTMLPKNTTEHLFTNLGMSIKDFSKNKNYLERFYILLIFSFLFQKHTLLIQWDCVW